MDFKIRTDEFRPIFRQDKPEPAALQPPEYDNDSLAEEFLVKSKNGAIAYVGCYTGSFRWTYEFVQRFFDGYAEMNPPVILGDLWIDAVERYIDFNFPEIDDFLNREPIGAFEIFHTPNKMMFFGDPSLRIGGVPE